MEQRISLVTFGVRDLGRALAFYKALGWSDAQQPDDEIAFFQAGGMVFGLWTALGGHGAPGIELAHNVRSPEEVDALLAAAQRVGATIVRPAARAEWGGYSGAFARRRLCPLAVDEMAIAAVWPRPRPTPGAGGVTRGACRSIWAPARGGRCGTRPGATNASIRWRVRSRRRLRGTDRSTIRDLAVQETRVAG